MRTAAKIEPEWMWRWRGDTIILSRIGQPKRGMSGIRPNQPVWSDCSTQTTDEL